MLLSNQKCIIQPTVINPNHNEYSQEFHYYATAVKLDKCVGNCNILNDFSNKVCVPNKTVDLNLSVFNMITGINESKTLTKHISCDCKCRFDVVVSVKNVMYVKKIMYRIMQLVVVKI